MYSITINNYKYKYDILIIGAGLSGGIIAREIVEHSDYKVLIIEKRNHVAGNLYDYKNNNILIQKYGPHILHTNNKAVYNYVRKYSEVEDYYVKSRAKIFDKFIPCPFNFTIIDEFYKKEEALLLKNKLLSNFRGKKSVPFFELLASDEQMIVEFGKFLFENDYGPYTAKQWGIKPEDVDKSILRRVPVLLSYYDGYFFDKYQFLPKKGFTEFYNNLINHKNIEVLLNTSSKGIVEAKDNQLFINKKVYKGLVIYTGALDDLLDYKFEQLPYRSLNFEFELHKVKSFQPEAICAYPMDKDYTRITEYTKLPIQNNTDYTIVAKEFPIEYTSNYINEPYYPIISKENMAHYQKYFDNVDQVNNLILCGRLAEYKYYNMDQAIENALNIFNDKILNLLT